jgi:Mn2+/Fe2+ NRAMP family transporter
VTTAAAAGAQTGPALLWALTFSTLGCIVLQEAAARLTIASGLSLGGALARRYPAAWPRALVAGAVLLGCAAYQAGNLLGAVAGLALVVEAPGWLLTTLVALLASGVLWWGGVRGVANLLGLVVAIMGIVFMIVAAGADVSAGQVVRAALVPSLPEGSLLLVVGLVGTTIVPYNLFLGSGIGQGQPLGQMRFGIAVAVGLGGAISAAILLAGTLVAGEFSYPALASALGARTGGWAAALFGWGLFAAGFTSAITAPLASAITVKSFFGHDEGIWQPRGRAYRTTWGLVMLFGAGFGLLGARPIPVILLAQAANGLLLPGLAVLLFWLVNDPALLPPEHRNGWVANALTLAVVWTTAALGTNQLFKTASTVLGASVPGPALLQAASLVATLLCLVAVWPVYRQARAS